MVPLAKFDISLKNAPPGLAPFCTESWQRFPPIFFSISLASTNIVVRVHTKNYGKTRKTKGIHRKKEDDVYEVEKILKSRGKGKNREVFVKWLGYPTKFNSWIPASEVKDI